MSRHQLDKEIQAARHADGIRPGYFLTRVVKDGPFMPARIWRPCVCTVGDEIEHAWQETCDRNPPLAAEINGTPADVWRVWTSRQEITESEYRYQIDANKWDRANDPEAPTANPNQSINPLAVKPLF